jgi:hypothetical protein
VSDRPRRLAGLREEIPLDEMTAYHAGARESALDAFGLAYERGLLGPDPAPGGTGGPTYVVAGGPDDELLVIAGVWPAAGTSCGRLVAPRELLAILLAEPTNSAVWCDEDEGGCFALTAYRVDVGGEAMLLLAARTARLVGETERGAEIAYDEERLREGSWTAQALDALVHELDGDALLAAETSLGDLAEKIQE